jgi:hypothetical protein
VPTSRAKTFLLDGYRVPGPGDVLKRLSVGQKTRPNHKQALFAKSETLPESGIVTSV